jgi:hypothetical protein
MPDRTLTGGCLCGSVRFEIVEPLVSAVYCHCTRCQRRTGTAAAASGVIAPGSLRITQGADLVRAYEPSEGFVKEFCGSCGSALWARNPADPGQLGVRLGAIDGDPGIRPSARQFVAYAAAWEPIPDDGLPRYPERRPPDAS